MPSDAGLAPPDASICLHASRHCRVWFVRWCWVMANAGACELCSGCFCCLAPCLCTERSTCILIIINRHLLPPWRWGRTVGSCVAYLPKRYGFELHSTRSFQASSGSRGILKSCTRSTSGPSAYAARARRLFFWIRCTRRTRGSWCLATFHKISVALNDTCLGQGPVDHLRRQHQRHVQSH